MHNTTEKQFIWVLEDNNTTTVFLGYDHVRRTSKSYSSYNHQKIHELAQKMAKDNSTDVIVNFHATITESSRSI